MKIKEVCYLPSGRVFVMDCGGYPIECTEMRDVAVGGKKNLEVRNTQDPRIIWKHLVPYSKKWLLTVSTQKGCPHNCKFCDVATLPFKGNLSKLDIIEQIEVLLNNTQYAYGSFYGKGCAKAKIGFARMGEPAHNLENVLYVIKNLNMLTERYGKISWLPCFNTILPERTMGGESGHGAFVRVMEAKEKDHKGMLHFQLSINSTDEEVRRKLFGGAKVVPLEEIIRWGNLFKVTRRTITLNFIVMEGVPVDVQKLKKMGLNGNKFTVKLIPLNKTNNGDTHDLKTYANYNSYEKLAELGQEFNNIGVPTVIDAIAKCEEAGLCCGQLAQIFL